MRVFDKTYEETLYAPLEVSLVRIPLSCRKIGRPSVVEDNKNVRLKAKNPIWVCRAICPLSLPTLKNMLPSTNPATEACITLVAKSCLVLNMLLQNLCPSIKTS